jgi:hypothetical protein
MSAPDVSGNTGHDWHMRGLYIVGLAFPRGLKGLGLFLFTASDNFEL